MDEKNLGLEVAIDDFLNGADMIISKRTGVIKKVYIMKELEQCTKATGGSVP